MKVFDKIFTLLGSDHWALVALALTKRAWRYFASAFYARTLRARGIHVGGALRIRGSKRICFGDDVYISGPVWIEAVTNYQGVAHSPRITIGNRVSLSPGVHISGVGNIYIGNDALLGGGVFIADHNHGTYRGSEQSSPDEIPARRNLSVGGTVRIGDNVWLGENVVVVGSVSIGYGSIVGANSVVSADIPPNCIAVGTPARPIKRYNTNLNEWERIS